MLYRVILRLLVGMMGKDRLKLKKYLNTTYLSICSRVSPKKHVENHIPQCKDHKKREFFRETCIYSVCL